MSNKFKSQQLNENYTETYDESTLRPQSLENQTFQRNMNYIGKVDQDRQNLFNSIIKPKDLMLQEKSSESKAKNMINIPAAVEPYHKKNGLDNDGMLINRVKQTKNS